MARPILCSRGVSTVKTNSNVDGITYPNVPIQIEIREWTINKVSKRFRGDKYVANTPPPDILIVIIIGIGIGVIGFCRMA